MKRIVLIQRSNLIGPQGGRKKGWVAIDNTSWEKIGGTDGSKEGLTDLLITANHKDQFTFYTVPGIWSGKAKDTIKAHADNVQKGKGA